MATDLTSQIAALHQTKTLVGLFKANYKTQPDLALEIYRTIIGALGHPSQFLYRDQVMALGLARLEPKLVFDLIPRGGTTYKLAQLYDIYQAALTDEAFRQATIDYFTQSGYTGNHVFRALTATPDSAVGRFLGGNIPQNFLEDATLLRMALALRLDGIWLAIEARSILPETLSQIRPAELVKLTRRAVANEPLRQALTTLGLFQPEVYCAYVLLTRGSDAFSALVNQFVAGDTPAVLEQVVAWVTDRNLELKPAQWQEIIEVIRKETKFSVLELFGRVNLATQVVMAANITTEGLRLKLLLAKTLSPESLAEDIFRPDLTSLMAKFQLTEADLITAMSDLFDNCPDRHTICVLLPWYVGSDTVLEQFFTKVVTTPTHLIQDDGDRIRLGPAVVSAWVYLAAISAGVTVPENQLVVTTVKSKDTAVLSYWCRKNWPKKVPFELLEFAEDMAMDLLETQSIVEEVYLVNNQDQQEADEF